MRKELLFLIIGIICAAIYTGGVVILGYEAGKRGTDAVQAKLDAQIKANNQLKLANDAYVSKLKSDIASANSKYEALKNAKPVSIASTIPAAISNGTLQLRDRTVCPATSKTTIDSREADAAATQALADRTATAIRIIRIGDAADERERQLDAQIVGLQEVLNAERTDIGQKADGK